MNRETSTTLVPPGHAAGRGTGGGSWGIMTGRWAPAVSWPTRGLARSWVRWSVWGVLPIAVALCACGSEGGSGNCSPPGVIGCQGDNVGECGENGQWLIIEECPAGCDHAACVTPCGNGVIDLGEQCDGANLGGQTCPYGGTLRCASDCTLDRSACEGGGDCGNGAIDPGEDCDGTLLGGATCASTGHGSGALACLSNCSFDFSACIGGPCGDGSCSGGETATSCCDDCGSCGDGVCCPGNENAATCCDDCGGCTSCGNGICDSGETDCPGSCPSDCSPVCGDGCCTGSESCSSCSTDCPPTSCTPGETQPCGACGHQTCAGCGWGACTGEGECAPGDSESLACTCGGTQTRSC